MIGRATMIAVATLALAGPSMSQTHHGGDPAIVVPGGGAEEQQTAEAPQADTKAVLDQLAQDVMVAQQVGYLAADKNMQAGYAMLGDQIALINSEINRRLDELVQQNNLNLPRVMNEDARARFEEMKALNQDRFAQSLVEFVNESYPRIIRGIEELSRQSPDTPAVAALSRDAVPRLREQMQSARQLAQAGGLGEQRAEEMNRGPIQRKDDPAVIPDTTPPRQ